MDEKLKKILKNVQKPGRYTGGEPGCTYKRAQDISLRFAFCFPDTYEIGMSYLGMKILYELLNDMPDVWCERAFMPWVDMADALKAEGYPLYALESKTPLSRFDALGFTLQYELSYTNVLAMLQLAGVALRAGNRGEGAPFVFGGGPCAANPEPLAAFFDAFFLGEGERQLPEVCQTLLRGKQEGWSRRETLRHLANIQGVYVPALYEVDYQADGSFKQVCPLEDAPPVVHKALLEDFSDFAPPQNFIVPMIGAVHDRAQVEVLRGCVRGCRFCQAGFIYRPMRQRGAAMLNESARNLCARTGYEELSLTSLSTSDHTQLEPLLDALLPWTQNARVSLSLPSLRVDNFTQSLVEKTTRVKKSGLTFAPEAGTQRLRDVINKNVTQEEIDRTVQLAFDAGYTSIKLYFMIGLPTETDEDIVGIAKTAQRVVDQYYANPSRPKGRGVKVSISVACFVPKPITPFQYCGQDTEETLHRKQKLLLSSLSSNKVSVSYHDSRISFLEAVFARGNRNLADVLERAFELGCRFDGWDDQFRYDLWMQAFEDCGLDPRFYANRPLQPGAPLPWGHLDFGVEESFLRREYEAAMAGAVTPPCSETCSACGAAGLGACGEGAVCLCG